MKKYNYVLCFIMAIFIFITCSCDTEIKHSPEEIRKWNEAHSKNNDYVLYECETDKFGFEGKEIFIARRCYYRKDYSYVIDDEEAMYVRNFEFDFYDLIEKDTNFKEPDDLKIDKIVLTYKELMDSEYSYLTEEPLYNILKNRKDKKIPDGKVVLFIINDKWLVDTPFEECDLKNEYYVRAVHYLYDIETQKPYYPDIAVEVNVPPDTIVPEKFILPQYYMNVEGKMICIYKYYNRLYCRRIN